MHYGASGTNFIICLKP